MRVLIVPSWYPNGADKLMGIYHKEYALALSKVGNIDVDMLYVDRQRLNAPWKYFFNKKKEVIKEDGYKVYIKKMLDVHVINEEWQLNRYVKVLDKAFREYLQINSKPDIIHAQVSMPAGYACCVLGKKYNIPVVVTEHASYFKRFFMEENQDKGQFILANSYFTTVSKFMAKEMQEYTSKKVQVLPNLVDTECFKLARKDIKDMRLITVSALREGKRIDDIMVSLKLLLAKHKDLKASLTIVGDGFIEDYYKKRCQELEMNEYVTFLGRCDKKEELAKILQEHNIFVIASQKETFCIPGVEALASGMPVVATKCLGPEEYIDKNCGELVAVNNPENMAEAIYKVYQNLSKYDVNYLRSIADKYSKEMVVKTALGIYEDAINNNKC